MSVMGTQDAGSELSQLHKLGCSALMNSLGSGLDSYRFAAARLECFESRSVHVLAASCYRVGKSRHLARILISYAVIRT